MSRMLLRSSLRLLGAINLLICFKNSWTWVLTSESENSNCDTTRFVSSASAIVSGLETGANTGNGGGFKQTDSGGTRTEGEKREDKKEE